jgi:hypothetical protein
MRGSGHSFANLWARVGGFVSPFIVNGSTSVSTATALISTWSVCTGLLCFAFPYETAGKALDGKMDGALDGCDGPKTKQQGSVVGPEVHEGEGEGEGKEEGEGEGEEAGRAVNCAESEEAGLLVHGAAKSYSI